MQLIPRDDKFFELFRQQAENLCDAARKFVALLEDMQDVEKRVTEIKFAEHKGDQMTHDLIMRLNKTFLTPFDREDIHELNAVLDDVLDLIDGVSGRLITYKITTVPEGARQLSRVILHGTEILLRAVSELHRPAHILEYCHQIKQLEEEGDRIQGACLAQLFDDSTDAIEIIKWKDLYEILEETTDRIDDVANVLETVILKSS